MAVDLKAGATEQLRSGWLSLVSEIADLDLQRRTWLDPSNRNPHWSYIEFVSSFPDREQISQGLQEGWLKEAEGDALNDLRVAIDAYSPPGNDPYDNAAVIGDPAWRSVAAAAELVKRQLLAAAPEQGRAALHGGT